MVKSVENLWESRYRSYGNRIEGVLQKSFPLIINKYLHEWMVNEIKKTMTGLRGMKVLDLGCGYGRLSSVILAEFPKCSTVGVDISKTSVELYNKSLSPRGKAYKGAITKLPFKNASFDIVFIVTTLMYLVDKKDQEAAIKELIRVLRTGGKFVVIERTSTGQKLVTLGGLVDFAHGAKNKEIIATSFDPQYIVLLLEKNGGKVTGKKGIPIWTITLPISFLLSAFTPKFAEKFLKLINFVDVRLGWLLTPSLYISYSGTKK